MRRLDISEYLLFLDPLHLIVQKFCGVEAPGGKHNFSFSGAGLYRFTDATFHNSVSDDSLQIDYFHPCFVWGAVTRQIVHCQF